MKKVICPVCKGRKKILGIGLIEKNCYNCDGQGYVDEENKQPRGGKKEKLQAANKE